MLIILNGDKEKIDTELSVLNLLQKFDFSPEVVTVSLNEEVLQRDDFASTLVKEGDSVDILMFMGGGKGELA